MNKLLLILLSLFISYSALAQPICGSDFNNKSFLNKMSGQMEGYMEMERLWNEYKENKGEVDERRIITGTDTVYEIPVVVHVIHTGGAIGTFYNRTDAQIQAWIDEANQTFAEPADLANDSLQSAVLPFRLKLATIDPDCNATTGIIRHNLSTNAEYVNNGVKYDEDLGVDEEVIYSAYSWPRDRYYNIYIVNKFDGFDGTEGGSFLAGYAYYPTVNENIYHTFMLSTIVEPGYNVLAHELGHALGLLHTFSASCTIPELDCAKNRFDESIYNGDGVCDTEYSTTLLGLGCPTLSDVNSCTGNPYEGVQYNIMNYTNCSNHFTHGQRERAEFMFLTLKSKLMGSTSAEDSVWTNIAPIAATCSTTTNNNVNLGTTYFSFNEIANSSDDYVGSGYISNEDFTNKCGFVNDTRVYTNQTYTIGVGVANPNPHAYAVYIDYNNDGAFNESDERVITGTIAGPAFYSGLPEIDYQNITIPESVVLNQPLRVRVVSDYMSVDILNACGTLDYGQSEDYQITILDDEVLNLKNVKFNVIANNCVATINYQGFSNGITKVNVQKSENGKDFSTISKHTYKDQVITEIVNDQEVVQGTYLYRLQMIEPDGRINYSAYQQVDIHCSNQFQVYPNPAHDVIHVSYEAGAAQKDRITILDATGKIVKQSEYMHQNSGKVKYEEDISGLTPGFYIIQLESGQKIKTAKFTKIK